MPSLLPPKPHALRQIFPAVEKVVIGVVHLPPLPGAPRYRGEPMADVIGAGIRDAVALSDGGVDGLIVENAFDLPFARPEDIGAETVAALSVATAAIREVVSQPIGITCVANGAIQALAVAKAVGARWVRVNQWANAYVANEGFLNGPAGQAMRYRSSIYAHDVAILADVHVKFGAHAITADRSIAEQARDAEFFDADAVIASGQRTGSPTDEAEINEIRSGTGLPLLIGSGVEAATAHRQLSLADGLIVGSWFKRDGLWWNPVDIDRVKSLMAEVGDLRERSTAGANGSGRQDRG